MLHNPLKSSNGFTYLAALMLVVAASLILAKAGESWQAFMQREREEELLFRGGQIRDAITRWNTPKPGQHPRTRLNDLKDLLRDPRAMGTVRYLRRLYKDPLTDAEWVVITDPVRGVVGVASSSQKEPIKKSGFSDDNADFEGKTKYSEWRFIYKITGAPAVPAGALQQRAGG